MKYLIVFLLFFCQCTDDDDVTPNFKNSFKGYTSKGLDVVCYEFDNSQCQSIPDDQVQYSKECVSKGNESFFCSCEQVLCSVDINSN